jgi:ATP-binding cassette, subfamily F, member 3
MSGGEKARIALAKTIISKANFLLLDEPTNHLDMHSVGLLIDALNKYQGSIILVSHDRYFVSKTANKIWEIVDGEIKEFKGTYTEYLEWKERMAKRAQETNSRDQTGGSQKAEAPAAKKVEVKTVSAPLPETNHPINKEVKKELQRQQKQLQQLEEKINTITTEKNKTEQLLSDPSIYGDKIKFQQTETSYQTLSKQLQQVNAEYEKVFEKVMELEVKVTE